MTRMDGRGLDRLDLPIARCPRRRQGQQSANQRDEARAWTTSHRASVASIASLTRRSSAPATVSRTTPSRGRARCVGTTTIPSRSRRRSVNANQFGYYNLLQQGIPTIVGPDISSGRVPLDRAAAEYTPEIDNIDRGTVHTWNVAFERRLSYDISVDVAYVGAKGVGGYAALDINAPQTLGVGNSGRPYASHGRLIAHRFLGTASGHALQLAAGRAQQAVHPRIPVQGRVHPEQGDE